MKTPDANDDIFVGPVGFSAGLSAEFFSSCDSAADLFHIDRVADDNSGMAEFSPAALSCIEPFGRIL